MDIQELVDNAEVSIDSRHLEMFVKTNYTKENAGTICSIVPFAISKYENDNDNEPFKFNINHNNVNYYGFINHIDLTENECKFVFNYETTNH